MQLHREREAIRARGAELVFVGHGNRRFGEGFRQDLGLTAPLYVDTPRAAYQALGMRRPIVGFLGVSTLKNGWRALSSGFRQKGIQGDPFQLGGVLVVLPPGLVAFRYLSDAAGDHPPVADILAALPEPAPSS